MIEAGRPFPPLGGEAASGDPTPRLDALRAELASRYDIEREIGHGGMARVYAATDRRTGERVAVKVLRPELSEAVAAARFVREIAIEGRLRHDNILAVADSGVAAGQLYCVASLIEGESLSDRLRREGPLSLDDTLSIARDVAAALDYAHRHGVIHRDVKPANILLTLSPVRRAVVADFGIAHVIGDVAGDNLTESGLVIGTPEYMSPEQGAGERQLDGRSDVYALGCVVYAMLAGEPPFTGPTPQAVIARHRHERPHSLRIVRPAISAGVERAVEKALSKARADRFATAGELVAALEAGLTEDPAARRERRSITRGAVVTLSVIAAAAGAALIYNRSDSPLDPNRVIVFPLTQRGAPPPGSAGAGEDVATFIGYGLAGAPPLTWVQGWTLFAADSDTARLRPGESLARTRLAGAGHYIDGDIFYEPSRTTVFLTLHRIVDGRDSVVARHAASDEGNASSVAQLGLRAAGLLLPALLEPGRAVDLTAIAARRPVAVANFLQGERAYRRLDFGAALAHYRATLADDSAFALAALKGAEAANWLGRFGDDVRLAEIALARSALLPPFYAAFARGLHAYLIGSADSALAHLERAAALDSSAAALWTVMGEVHLRLLPSRDRADSLGLAALMRARRADPEFAPALLLLEENAVRSGDMARVSRLAEEIRLAGADTTHALQRQLSASCASGGAASVDWQSAVRRDPASVLKAGVVLGSGAANPLCAYAAYRAILTTDSAITVPYRWGALLAVQSLLVAVDRTDLTRAVFKLPSVGDLPVWSFHLINAGAGIGFYAEAAREAQRRTRYDDIGPPTLWALGRWHTLQGDSRPLAAIAQVLRRKADSSAKRRDVLLAHLTEIGVQLVARDTAGAIRRLEALTPSAPRNDLAWQPWESLGNERMLLAELLRRRGDLKESARVAARLDATEPLIYPLYLRRSLALRLEIATALGDSRSAARIRARLEKLTAAGRAMSPM
jgi:tRNA A-37 threonylcarbamoyl transferase component Bud32